MKWPDMPRTDEGRQEFVEDLEEERETREHQEGLEDFYDQAFFAIMSGRADLGLERLFVYCDNYVEARDKHVAKKMEEYHANPDPDPGLDLEPLPER